MKSQSILALALGMGSCVFLFCATGCTNSNSEPNISGVVTWNGASLEKGSISFSPIDQSGTNTAGAIENGQYRCPIRPGQYRVEIRSPKVVGTVPLYGTANGPSRELAEELIPKRYNDESELTVTVTADNLQKDFELVKSDL